jgi:uncharacterized membrane protein YcaP (DUF421 family)
MFFDDWSGVLRVVVMGVAGYVALIVMLRGAGKRALAKLNAFDLIVTIALGSTLASVLLSSSVALAEGLTAMALLLAMQYLVAWGSTRNRHVKRLVSSAPTLVYHRGFLRDPMHKERVTADELRQAARGQGYADLADVIAIVLETDGSLSILTASPPVDSTN